MFKIYQIIWVSFLISIPIYLLVLITMFFVTLIFYVMQPDKRYLLALFFPAVLYFSHGLLLPFWQSVKAVVFYQLTQKNNQLSIW